jgi:hypothetical protein
VRAGPPGRQAAPGARPWPVARDRRGVARRPPATAL